VELVISGVVLRKHILIGLISFFAACSPRLQGGCASDADCRPGQTCGSTGICLGGQADAGAGQTAAIQLTAPISGAAEPGRFPVSATVTSDLPPSDVTFFVAANGKTLGTLKVQSGTDGSYGGTLVLDDTIYTGLATVQAILHRAGSADVTSPSISVQLDQVAPIISSALDGGSRWFSRDASISFAANVVDEGSGIAAAELVLADGGTSPGTPSGAAYTFDVPAADLADPGTESLATFTIRALDKAGNVATRVEQLSIDDVPPTLSADPADANAAVWHSAAAGNLTFSPTVQAIDHGSGVANVTVAGTAAMAMGNGLFRATGVALPSAATLESDALVLEVTAQDAVGNASTAKLTFKVDNNPPVVSAAHVDTAFDGTDASGQGWFRGPSADPAGGSIVVSAVISDPFLVTSGDTAPVAIVGGARIVGTFAGGRWSFSLPRSIGVNATGAVGVTFDAQDLAGNHAVSPTLALLFDDLPATSFMPVIPEDAVWYAQGASLTIPVTLGAVPRSGLASVALTLAGQPASPCVGADLTWSCNLPTSSVVAGAEVGVPFTISAASFSGVTAVAKGTRNVDGAPPVVTATVAVPYPPAATGPMAWSHDGSHFNLRDNGTLYTFKAYDCGAGVRGVQSLTLTPSLGAQSVSVTDSGARQACANGTTATVFDVSVSGDLSTSAPGSFAGADNALTISVAVADRATDVSGSPAPHSTSATAPVSVTRRLWQTGPSAARLLALGPTLIASGPNLLTGLRTTDGTALWTNAVPVLSGPVIGGTASAPVGYIGQGSKTQNNTIVAFDLSTGMTLNTCGVFATPSLPAGCKAPSSLAVSNRLAITSTGAALMYGSVTNTGANTTTGDTCGAALSAAAMLGSACTLPGGSTPAVVGQLTVGRGGRAFFVAEVDDFAAGTTQSTLGELSIANGSVVTSSASCRGMALTDDAGNDSPLCDQGRYTFDGASMNARWFGSNPSPAATVPAADEYFAGTNRYGILSGALSAFNLGVVLAVDGSTSPIVYAATGAKLAAIGIDGSPARFGLPGLPGTAVLDLAMDKHGNAYVVSDGGQVSAIATDSPGLGTASFGWATRGRDACRSSSLDFTCPF
jgi:hypothetical protein